MQPLWCKVTFVAGLVALTAIRVPHDRISRQTPITQNRKGRLESLLLALMGLGGFALPLTWVFSTWLHGADRTASLPTFAVGVAVLLFALWLFHRSHVDLGRNWSVTLQVREGHRIVDRGVYRSIRHPMYSAIFAYALAQALIVPNWIAGPSCFVAFAVMFACRLGPEEQMMLDTFGSEYVTYRQRTKRLIPGIW